MNSFANELTVLATLLEYPGRELEAWLRGGGPAERRRSESALAAPAQDAAATALGRFAAAMSALPPDEREGLYTATFDVTPVCVPYVSIHLFGEENFKRGEFMAALQARYRQAGFDARGELPDHLAVLLRFAARTDEPERRELFQFCLLGPVARMIEALSETNPYRSLLQAVRETLQGAYPEMRPAASPLEQMRRHGMPCAPPADGCHCPGIRTEEEPFEALVKKSGLGTASRRGAAAGLGIS
jgi:nitrate reductase delta subunit